MALTFLSPHTKPEVTNAKPLSVKHPLLKYTVGHRSYKGKNKLMWAFERTDGLWTHFISFEQMLYHMDRDDVCTL